MSYIQSGLNYRIVIFKLHLILVLSKCFFICFSLHRRYRLSLVLVIADTPGIFSDILVQKMLVLFQFVIFKQKLGNWWNRRMPTFFLHLKPASAGAAITIDPKPSNPDCYN